MQIPGTTPGISVQESTILGTAKILKDTEPSSSQASGRGPEFVGDKDRPGEARAVISFFISIYMYIKIDVTHQL